MKKVLVVEDCESYQRIWSEELNGKVELVSAFSIREAEEKFAANPDIVAIVMDACVPGSEPTTPPLVRKFRTTFTGPMIAASSDEKYRKELMLAGCDYQSNKSGLPEVLCKILGV
jgi:CheY-like chemotaxis protein